MQENPLKESYEKCRNRGKEVMEGIASILDSANISHRSNNHNTEIIADQSVKKVRDLISEDRSSIDNVDFMVSAIGQQNKTYIRLLYQ